MTMRAYIEVDVPGREPVMRCVRLEHVEFCVWEGQAGPARVTVLTSQPVAMEAGEKERLVEVGR